MKIVVGLGNPGKRYERTPHNAGFMVIEALCKRFACRMRRSFRFPAGLAKAYHEGEWVHLVKPRTYMNNSGQAVTAVLQYFRGGPEDLLVVVDDADLPLGRMRVRPGGSSGGHRGLESIIAATGRRDFARLRVGIGRRREGDSLIDHVLTPFSSGERRLMESVVDEAVKAVLCVVVSGPEAAMNGFNGTIIAVGQEGQA